ncbi:MAG: hypothetical protein WBP81_19215 [Solirubrobacteraceae bacterium]
MTAYDPNAWTEFAAAAAGASAVLAGLVFVAVSINLEKVLEVKGLPGRAGETIATFLGALIASLLVVVPGQSNTAVGIELAVGGGVLLAGLMLIVFPGLQHHSTFALLRGRGARARGAWVGRRGGVSGRGC